MRIIELAIEIQAPIELVFDLSRSIDLHVETPFCTIVQKFEDTLLLVRRSATN